MAEKVTTLRLKAVGWDESATVVDSAFKKISAGITGIDNANKALTKAQVGGVQDEIDKAGSRVKDLESRLARMKSRLGETDPVKLLGFQAEDVKDDLAKRLANQKLGVEERVALEKVAAVQLADIQRKVTEEESNAWRAQADAARKAGAQRYEEQVKVEQKLAELSEKTSEDEEKSFRKAMEAASKAGNQRYEEQLAIERKMSEARDRSIQDEEKAWRKSADAAQKAGAKRYEEAVKIDAELLKEQDRAAKEFGKQLEKEQEDARRESRNQEKLDKTNGGGLSGFGGKMIIGMAAGRAAGDVLGDANGGREIGSAISGFMFGGPVLGAAVVGLDMIGEAFKTSRENAVLAQNAAKEYTQAIKDLSDEWSSLSAGISNSDVFETAMKKMAKSGRVMSDKAQDVLDDQGKKGMGGFFGEAWSQSFFKMIDSELATKGIETHLGDGQTSSELEAASQNKIQVAALAARRSALEYEKEEVPKVAADRERILAAETKVSQLKIAASRESRESRRSREAIHQAEIEVELEKMNATKRQQLSLADASVQMAQKELDLAIEKKDVAAEVYATENRDEAIRERQNIQDEWQQKFAEKQLADDVKIADQKKRLMREQHQEASDRYVSGFVDFTGFAVGMSGRGGMGSGGGGGGQQSSYTERPTASDETIGSSNPVQQASMPARDVAISKPTDEYSGIRTELGDAVLGPDGLYHVKSASAHGLGGALTPQQYANLRASERSKVESVRTRGTSQSPSEKHAAPHATGRSGEDYGYSGVRTELGDAVLGADGLYHIKSSSAHGMGGALTPEQYENMKQAEKAARPNSFLGPTGSSMAIPQSGSKTIAEMTLNRIEMILKDIKAQGQVS